MNVPLARFEAPTMNEALEKIRAVFGADGMIVGTRTSRRGGVLGVGGQEVVEVFVADTRSRAENIKRQALDRGGGSSWTEGSAAKEMQAEPMGLFDAGSPAEHGYELLSSKLNQLRDEIKDLLARSLEHGGFTHPFLRECYDYLLARDVEPRFADSMVREMANLPPLEAFPILHASPAWCGPSSRSCSRPIRPSIRRGSRVSPC